MIVTMTRTVAPMTGQSKFVFQNIYFHLLTSFKGITQIADFHCMLPIFSNFMNVNNILYLSKLRRASEWHFPFDFYQIAFFNTQFKLRFGYNTSN